MTQAEALKKEITQLQGLAILQRTVRLSVRALWLFGAGLILGWGANALTGMLPDWRAWLALGVALGLLPILGIAFALRRRSAWVWSVDRRLGLQEQVSTAWETAERGESTALSAALVTDVLAFLPDLRSRMLRHGWFLERDLLAGLIVLLLGGLALSSVWINSLANRLERNPLAEAPAVDPVDPFPQLTPTEPPQTGGDSQEQAPGNQPGQDGGQNQAQGEAGGSGNDESSSQDPSTGSSPSEGSAGTSPGLDPGALSEALKGLGQDLSQQAPTYDLGQKLQGSDLNGAAGEMDQLNDQLKNLSPETRQKLADALKEASGDVGAAGDQQLSEDMNSTAEALQGEDSGQSGSDSSQALDQLAQDLRDRAGELNNAQANGSGAGGDSSGQTGSAEPTGRLQGEGGDLELPLDDSAQSGLLSPAPPQAGGSGTASGSLDSTGQSEDGAAGSPLVPNSFLWKWRDVVSSYFQR